MSRRATTARSGRATRPRVDLARQAAYDVLTAVRLDAAYANLVLPQVLRKHNLSGRDAALTTELASGTIRMQGLYDPVIDACLSRPKLQASVRDVLRLGAHQLLSMRVPDHAAISTSVDLVRANVGVGPAGLVNAVLRRISQEDRDTWVDMVAPGAGEDVLGRLAVAESHPRWVVEALAESLTHWSAQADDSEDLGALIKADNAAPQVTLVALPGLSTTEELLAHGSAPTAQSRHGVLLDGGDPASVQAVVEGRAGVQDEGSQLVALALAEAPLDGPDHLWLDLCAGPGGKAALLAALAAPRGAVLLANERQPHRAALVKRALRALPSNVAQVVVGDGTAPAWRPRTFDRTLVDAPCSGLGALRRRPEARWRRSPTDLDVLVPLQEALLRSAIAATRSGGVVVYATCSPVLAETRDVVDRVTSGRDDVSLESQFQLWPHRDGTDAMYAATLRVV